MFCRRKNDVRRGATTLHFVQIADRDPSRRCACYASNELQPNGCVNCPVGHELPCDMNCAYRHIAVAIQFTERSEKSWRSQFMTVTPSIHFNAKELWSKPGLLFELIVPQSDIHCVSVCTSTRSLRSRLRMTRRKGNVIPSDAEGSPNAKQLPK